MTESLIMPVAQPSVQYDISQKTFTDELKQLLQEDLINVNKMIITYLNSDVSLIPRIAQHLIMAGGKRVRPLLTIASAKLCGYTGNCHIPLAAAIEFVHAATLLHDDVIDESDKRRGRTTANTLWGNKASILVGDFLFARSFELMVKTDSIDVLETIAKASKTITEGEILQLDSLNNLEQTEENYLRIIGAKTATLFSAGCKSGAMLATKDVSKISALSNYGYYLGMIFQMMDDILDYTGNASEIGKEIGKDLLEGKVTLPLIHAFQKANGTDRRFMMQLLDTETISPDTLSTLLALFQKYQSITYALEKANTYHLKAIECLRGFQDGFLKTTLINLAASSTQRLS
jgi:octaprenyl-diphosphate synthase